MQDFLSALRQRVLIADGAMGTLLHRSGLPIKECPEAWNLSRPEIIADIHKSYVLAGADLLETNTFGGNRVRLERFGLAEQVLQINTLAVRLAREASDGAGYVAGAMGPLGARSENIRAVYREQAEALDAAGVDVFLLETFYDLNELLQAIRGVRDVSERPVIAQMTVEEEGDTCEHLSAEVIARVLNTTSAEIIGLNCSLGPKSVLNGLKRMAGVTPKPLAAQPSAGLPADVACTPEEMAAVAGEFAQTGARIIGGCCGTTPEHIRALRRFTGPKPV